MQILIGCAKDMTVAPAVEVPQLSEPLFLKVAERNARQMAAYNADELKDMLGISQRLAEEVHARYEAFFRGEGHGIAAIAAYHGVVFKNIQLERFTHEDFSYAQHHLWITSFLYGLLRPLDAIRPYRLEGKIELPDNGMSIFAFWRRLLTDHFISSIKNDDGILIDLASAEMRSLFNWQDVEKAVEVVKPNFYVEKNGKLTMPSVHAKKCRGAMTSWLIRNRISDPSCLCDFSFNGAVYRGNGGNLSG